MCAFLVKGRDLDLNKLITMALVHDLGEVVIGDLRWENGKKVIGDYDKKHKDEGKAIKKLFEKIKNADGYISLWQEFNEQKTAVIFTFRARK